MSDDEETANLPTDVIEKCFFIKDGEADEQTPEEEILLYFYPETYPLRQQILLAGAVESLTHYIAGFTDEPVRTLTMTKVKFSVLRLGSYMLFASGPAEEADSVLLHHIETLYAAYIFYWGPIEDVGVRFQGAQRREFVNCINRQCQRLVPLLDGFRDKGKLNAFIWLPFSSPPPNTARHFMQASNILSAVQTEESVYGGCMFYESEVLCTHMDVEVTRWMLNIVELLRKQDSTERGRRSSYIPVYLTKEQCQKLNIEVEIIADVEGDDPVDMYRTDLQVQDRNRYKDTDTGIYVTLCIFSIEKISLALLMQKKADFRLLGAISMKRQLETRLTSLEKEIMSSYHKGTRSTSHTLVRDFSEDNIRSNFHFLSTDSLTGMTKGTILKVTPDSVSEREDRFLVGSSFVHEAFCDNREINKVMLSDHCGLFYGRHMFSKEIFYQRYNTNSETLPLERIEEISQQNLSDHFNINLI